MATDTRWLDEHGDEIDEDHRGLVYDLRTLVDRRRVGPRDAAGGALRLERPRRTEERTSPTANVGDRTTAAGRIDEGHE